MRRDSRKSNGAGSRAFTLLELLAVMAIMAVLVALSIPALSFVNGYNLTSAGQTMLGQLTYARQDALANNRAVQVRFYQIPDVGGTSVYRAMQVFRESTDGSGNSTITAVTKPFILPGGMWIVNDTTASSLFSTATSGAKSSTGDPANVVSTYGNPPYVYFRFRPNGQTDLTASSTITVAWKTAPITVHNLPANFITLQIDAVNGGVLTYQP